MGSRSDKWKRVTRDNVCPICKRHDWCMVGDDAVLCMRIESQKPTKNGGWIWPLSETVASEWQHVKVSRKPCRTNSELDAIWRPRSIRWQEHGRCELDRLATVLGVTIMALWELNTGWDGKAWTFPERDEGGLVLGISRRFEDGHKRCAVGSRRGLTYSDRWNEPPGPVLLVEGASDVAAGITLGLSVIGRPSNRGGLEYLARLLPKAKRKIIVIGERDRKPDGRWPGWDGCRSVAVGLSKALRRGVTARLLPEAKDLRAWLNKSGPDATGEMLLRELREWRDEFYPKQ